MPHEKKDAYTFPGSGEQEEGVDGEREGRGSSGVGHRGDARGREGRGAISAKNTLAKWRAFSEE
jgi:hypothetical protein